VKNRKIRRPAGFFFDRIIAPAAVLAAVLLIFAALSNLDGGQGEEARLQLEESLRRGAAACYATEGIYPPDLNYLKEHYGIQIDERRYHVHYDIFGSNIMPDITVVEK